MTTIYCIATITTRGALVILDEVEGLPTSLAPGQIVVRAVPTDDTHPDGWCYTSYGCCTA